MPSGVPLYNETPEGSIDFKDLSFQRKPKQRLFPVLREMSAEQTKGSLLFSVAEIEGSWRARRD